MDPTATTAGATLDEVVRTVRSHPGLRGKASIGLVTEVLGSTDWLAGPGDDAALIEIDGKHVLAGGEALWPPFVEADPNGAGIAAVLTNVNDLAAMGARPLGIVDTIVAPQAVARDVLEGMRYAAELYRVPIIGGHLTVRDGPSSVSAFGVGAANSILSMRNVEPGQALLVATCVDGRMREDFPFFPSFAERGSRLADDVRVLADLAETGLCVAAKDVSMAGVLGSTAMLLEWSRAGGSINLGALPRPSGVALSTWAITFPCYSFVLCVPPDRVATCRDVFRRRELECEEVAVLDSTGLLRVRLDAEERVLLDFENEPITGLGKQA
jgi:selenophosphate synthetase-related protein